MNEGAQYSFRDYIEFEVKKKKEQIGKKMARTSIKKRLKEAFN